MPRSIFQQRRDTQANWTANNPVLHDGQLGVATDTVPRSFKIGDGATAWNDLPYASSGAAIDDVAPPNTNDTWSSAKIKEEIDSTVVASVATPPAQLDVVSITDNNGAVVTVNITNYNPSYTYLVTSGNTSVATVARSGSVITVTLEDVTGNQTTDLTVNVYEATFAASSNTVVPITNNDLDPTEADDLIQITNFAADVDTAGVAGFDYVNGITATVNAAYWRSTVFEQEVGDTNWVSMIPKVTVETNKLDYLYVDGFDMYLAPRKTPTAAKAVVIDTVGNEFTKNIVVQEAPAGDPLNAEWTSWDSMSHGWESGPGGSRVSGDGSVFFRFGTDNTIRYAAASTPFRPDTLGSSSSWSTPSSPSGNPNGGMAGGWISPDGKYMLTLDRYFGTDASYAGIRSWSLATPNDPSTAVETAILQHSGIAGWPLSPYTISQYTNISMDVSKTHMYISMGNEMGGSNGPNGYVIHCQLSTPGDITTATVASQLFSTSYNYYDFQIAPDGMSGLLLQFLDDNGGYHRHYVVKLSTAYDLSSVSYHSTGNMSSIESLPDSFFASNDGLYLYTYGLDQYRFKWKQLTNPIWKGFSKWTIDSTDIIEPMEDFYAAPEIPRLFVDHQSLEENLVPANAPEIAFVSEPLGLYNPVNGVLKREYTYAQTSINARYLQPRVMADVNENITKIAIELDKAGTVGSAPQAEGGDIVVTSFENYAQANNGYTYRV